MDAVLGGFFDNDSIHLDMQAIVKSVGERIRIIRRSRFPEMSIEELAERAQLSRQTIGAVETGSQPMVALVTIQKIAEALGLSLEALIAESRVSSAYQVAEKTVQYESIDETLRQQQQIIKQKRSPQKRKTA